MGNWRGKSAQIVIRKMNLVVRPTFWPTSVTIDNDSLQSFVCIYFGQI